MKWYSFMSGILNSRLKGLRNSLKVSPGHQLTAGENKSVTLTLKGEDLAYWDERNHAFRVEPGKVEIMIGASSQDIRLKKTITV